jgi:hypothetical protein
MHIVEYPVTEEDGLDWPKNSGEFYVVHSAEEKNGTLRSLSRSIIQSISWIKLLTNV